MCECVGIVFGGGGCYRVDKESVYIVEETKHIEEKGSGRHIKTNK